MPHDTPPAGPDDERTMAGRPAQPAANDPSAAARLDSAALAERVARTWSRGPE